MLGNINMFPFSTLGLPASTKEGKAMLLPSKLIILAKISDSSTEFASLKLYANFML